MKCSPSGVFIAACAACSTVSAAEDQPAKQLETVVVTATRTKTPIEQVGSAITVITAEEIANRKLDTVADVLRVVPGLDVLRAGGIGQQTSVFLRGANSNHTLMLIDGIEMNDPSNPNGAFDFADLQADNIERIEILRGAASAIYGSDAIGGVINIITKKGHGKPRFQTRDEGGSYNTFKVGGGVSGGTERASYSLNVSRLESGGFSAADRAFGNTERDSYKNSSVSARTGVQALDDLDFGWTLRYNEGKAMVDNCGGPNCDDPNAYTKNNELFTRVFGHLSLLDGVWEQTLGFAYSDTNRTYFNPFDPANPYTSKAFNVGEKSKIDWQNVLHLHETNTVTVGVEEEADSFHSESSFSMSGFSTRGVIPIRTRNDLGYYLQDQIQLFDRSFTTIGIRDDQINRGFGNHVTWRANQVYAIPETGTHIKGSYGTAFKAPALFQLFDTIFDSGNPNLKAETSRNWDVGFEQAAWDERVQMGASYFNNAFVNLILNLPPNFKSENIGHATAEGVESFVEFRPLEGLSLRGNYTYTKTQDQETGQRLLRRPTHKGSFDADYRFLEKASVHLNILMVGNKNDVSTLVPRVLVPGYVLVNLAVSYDLDPKVQVFARVDNLLNKHYEEIFGFGAANVSGYCGVKMTY